MNIRLRLIYTVSVFLLLYTSISFSFARSTFAARSWNNEQISTKKAVPSYPQLEAGKRGYGTVWVDDRFSNSELYFASINNSGHRVGKELRVTNSTVHNSTPAMVWNGKDYGLFWSYDKSQIYFTRINESGKKVIGNIPTVTTTSGYAIHISAVWNGEEYGVVWWDGRDNPGCDGHPGTRGRAFFVRVDKDGNKIGNEMAVSDAFSNTWQDYKPLIAWDGTNYAIFWNDSREAVNCWESKQNIYMSKVSASGVEALNDTKLQKTSSNSNLYSAVWDGSNYALTYNVGTSFFAKMDPSGSTLLADIPINTTGFSGSPKISWDGANYYVSWFDNRDRTATEPNNNEIYFAKLDTNGTKVTPETRITSQKEPSIDNTQIVFGKRGSGIAWLDYRKGSPQVFFANN